MAASQRDKHLHDWVSATYQLTVGFPGRQTPEQLGQTAARRLLEGLEPARGGAYGDSALGFWPPRPAEGRTVWVARHISLARYHGRRAAVSSKLTAYATVPCLAIGNCPGNQRTALN